MIHTIQYIIKSDDICEVGLGGIQFHIPGSYFIFGFDADAVSFEVGGGVYFVSLLYLFIIVLAREVVLFMSGLF